MKYFIDTEFIEGPQKTFFGYTKPTIDLISIGIVAEDGREYYAISKDFNLIEAWRRYDLKEANTAENHSMNDIRVYWIRENVLKNLFPTEMNFTQFKKLINHFGKSNKQIAKEVIEFCNMGSGYSDFEHPEISNVLRWVKRNDKTEELIKEYNITKIFDEKPEFYAYYGDYDWVVFCWLFGNMIDLPKEFPKYCKDLQQTFDEKKKNVKGRMKDQPGFPINDGIHNALEDARWNYKLYKFLNTL
jgi:hypothetical protein